MNLGIRKNINYLYLKISFGIFYCLFLKYSFGKNRLIIFDIDNTVANSWPSLLDKHQSERDRLISIPAFQKVVEIIDFYVSTGEKVLFLTARDYKSYFVTLQWLSKIGFGKANLVMVSNPSEKIKILKSASKKNILLYDDMSYNHENGIVKFYKNEILQISKMKNIKYFDYNYLLKLHD